MSRAGAAADLPRSIIVAACPFSRRLDADRAARALASGITRATPAWSADPCPLEAPSLPSAIDQRLAGARALVIAVPRLTPAQGCAAVAWELATNARQGGIPEYGVSSRPEDPFHARLLDLQVVLQARGERGLHDAGARLAALV